MKIRLSGPRLLAMTSIALIALYAWQIAPIFIQPERLDCDGLPDLDKPQVVIYGTSWCVFCRKARWFMEDHQIAYCEYDVEKSRAGAEQFEALRGGHTFPLIRIGPELVHGFEESEVKRVLQTQGLLADTH